MVYLVHHFEHRLFQHQGSQQRRVGGRVHTAALCVSRAEGSLAALHPGVGDTAQPRGVGVAEQPESRLIVKGSEHLGHVP